MMFGVLLGIAQVSYTHGCQVYNGIVYNSVALLWINLALHLSLVPLEHTHSRCFLTKYFNLTENHAGSSSASSHLS